MSGQYYVPETDSCVFEVDRWMNDVQLEDSCPAVSVEWCDITSEDVRSFYAMVADGDIETSLPVLNAYLAGRVVIESLINNIDCNGLAISPSVAPTVDLLGSKMTRAYCPANSPDMVQLKEVFTEVLSIASSDQCSLDVSPDIKEKLLALFDAPVVVAEGSAHDNPVATNSHRNQGIYSSGVIAGMAIAIAIVGLFVVVLCIFGACTSYYDDEKMKMKSGVEPRKSV